MPTRELFHPGTPVQRMDRVADFSWYAYNMDSKRHFLVALEEFEGRHTWIRQYNLVFACGMKRYERWARRSQQIYRMRFVQDESKFCPECLKAYHKYRFNNVAPVDALVHTLDHLASRDDGES